LRMYVPGGVFLFLAGNNVRSYDLIVLKKKKTARMPCYQPPGGGDFIYLPYDR
jgi:hypothetical protein